MIGWNWMETIDKTALVWMLGSCVTIIFALVGYIFTRQGKDIKENRRMLNHLNAKIQKQDLAILHQSDETKLITQTLRSIKDLFNKQFDSLMTTIQTEVELAVIKERK